MTLFMTTSFPAKGKLATLVRSDYTRPVIVPRHGDPPRLVARKGRLMRPPSSVLRDHARAVWQAAVAAADPFALVRDFLAEPPPDLRAALASAKRVLVVGGGKAGAAMAAGVEAALADRIDRVVGVVNVPAETVRPLSAVRLHAARPAGTNQPTAESVAGVRDILDLVRSARPGDVCLCLLSGGGSALLPAPADGLTLEDKQRVTLLLHACGATIDEMNCVRKHLSAVKGGRLAQAFAGEARSLFSLVISDVIGDPLDVIASGPTAADPTTFADALDILARRGLEAQTPPGVLEHLRRGKAGEIPETLKTLPAGVVNVVLGNNQRSLAAAERKAGELGYRVLNLGSFIEGETRPVAVALAGIVRSVCRDGVPGARPFCLLSGGETTVTLTPGHGKGGRNQEFVLAAAAKLGPAGMRDVVVLSSGTDGEDGPTDAAGAVADADSLRRAAALGLNPTDFLDRHDAYTFFDATGDLLRTGLTGTNVMDVRVILVGRPAP
jgi:hydroxypyruvate reductase/glycerate 2-kinase